MPVVVQYTTNVGPDEYDRVVSRIRFHDDLPPGLIMHTASVSEEGRMRIFDVWHSREAHDEFAANRLLPAIAEVVGSAYADQRQEEEVHELHSLVKPVHGPRLVTYA